MDTIVVITLEDRAAATAALRELHDRHDRGRFDIRSVAVVDRHADGSYEVRDGEDPTTAEASVSLGIAGAIAGALAGPVGSALGGVAGAVVGSTVDRAQPPDPEAVATEIGGAIPPGCSGLIADVVDATSAEIDDLAQRVGGRVVRPRP